MNIRIIDGYFNCWAIVLPITTFLVFPSVQGTTPAYLFALTSIFVVIAVSRHKGQQYLRDLLVFFTIFVAINSSSQLFLSINQINDFGDLILVNKNDSTFLLRSSLFTQSIYLIAAISTFYFVKHFYHGGWDRAIYIGASFLALYGIYEVIYFLIFNENGDFLSNRFFSDGHEDNKGFSIQYLDLGILTIQRLKSLTSEASTYAFTILPFWIYAVHQKKTKTHILLFISLVLTTSATAVLGIFIYFILRVHYYGIKDKFNLSLIAFMIMGIIIGREVVFNFFKRMIWDKITLNHSSGVARFDSFYNSIEFFWDLAFINQLFGLGFGYIRSVDMFSTLLVNNGYIGFLLFTFLFIYPVIVLKKGNIEIGLKCSIIIVYITMMISVPEFSYLSSWLFLGMAYKKMKIGNSIKDI
jgi:hypothetical protein